MKQKQLILTGITISIAILTVLIALLFLSPTPGDGKNLIKVRFQNIEKIAVGTRVTFAGRPVGTVKQITLLKENIAGRMPRDSLGIYPYELLLQLDSSIHVFPQDEIVVHTSGLMGEKTIAIIPHASTGSEEEAVKESTILYGKDMSNMESTLNTLSEVVRKADLTIDRVFSTVDKSQENITSAATSLNQASGQMNSFIATLNDHDVARQIATLTQTATECFQTYTALAKTALKGDNSVSRLLQNDAFLLDAEKTMDRMNALLDAVLEYGFFFHSNASYRRAFMVEQTKPEEVHDIVDRARKTLLDAKRNLVESSDPNKHEALIESINNALLSLPLREQVDRNTIESRAP